MDNLISAITSRPTVFFALLLAALVCKPIESGQSPYHETGMSLSRLMENWSLTARDVFPDLDAWNEPAVCDASLDDIILITDSQAERDLHALIVRTAERYEVEAALVKAIIMAESRFNPNARSRAGAMGLMQIMPATARSLGVENVFDPEENIDAGVRYFKKMLRYVDGDVTLALAAYNAGLRNVRHYRGIPPFRETQSYIRRVFEYRSHYMGRPSENI